MPIRIIKEDITKIKCDAIVNPTNVDMRPSGGADAAIHHAAGPGLLKYCRGLGKLSVGDARITPAFDLPCKFVIHTVGPMWEGGLAGERFLLRSCYTESLKLAMKNGCTSVAFPLIASGEYGYPKDSVLKEATEVIGEVLEECEMDVYIVVYDKNEFSINPIIYDDLQAFIDIFYEEMRSDACYVQSERCDYRLTRTRRSSQSVERTESLDNQTCYRLATPISPASSLFRSRKLEDMLKEMDKGFADTLFYYIDKRNMTDVEAYKRSNVSKKTFSKIKCNSEYRPSKETAVSFAIGLHLSLDETKHLLSTAGMCLSHSNKFDVVIEYFIITGRYETIFDVNEVLYQFDLPLLGV